MPYFINKDYGFLYTPGVTGINGMGWVTYGQGFVPYLIDPPSLFRTLDGGLTWQQMDIGEIATKQYAMLLQMSFPSPSHGYMVGYVSDPATGYQGGLYETIDSGAHWNRISPNGMSFVSLCLADSLIFLVRQDKPNAAANSIYPDSIVVYNMNTGVVGEYPPGGVSIVSNGDSIVYSRHLGQSGGPQTMRSSDQGKTWLTTENGATSYESWSLYAAKHTNIVIRAAEIHHQVPYSFIIDYSAIQASNDGGQTWNSLALLPIDTISIGDVEGDGCAIYVRRDLAGSPFLGLYRSTDLGVTWQNVGGPAHRPDCRSLSVVEGGSVVYAAEDSGDPGLDGSITTWTNLWRTTDGGDGALPSAYHPTITVNSAQNVNVCNSSRGFVKIVGNRCSEGWVFSSATIGGDTIHFLLDSLTTLPESIGGVASDSFYFTFNPLLQPGKFTGNLHLHFTSFAPDTNAAYDTTITINAEATPVPPQLFAPTSMLDFGSLSTCNGPVDSIIVFTDSSCAPDTITQASISGTGFTGSFDSLPIIVQKDSSVTLRVHFQPPGQGSFQGSANLSVTSMGLSENPAISLTGQGVQGEGILDVLSTSLQAGSISFCGGDTAVSDAIHDLGCDTLVITNVRFSGDTTFSLVSQPTDSILPPHDSTFFQFHFAPRLKGGHTAQVTFHSRNIHGGDPGHDTTITISGIGVGGTSELSVDQTPRNFGSLYICQSKDTTITLYNKGCDTLRVDSASISNGAYTLDTTYPMLILPDSSAFVKIRLTPDAGSLNGTITFSSNANTGVGTATVQLQAKLLQPASLKILFGPSDSANGGDIVTGYVILEGSIPAGQISSLAFDITHNDDLLTFLNASGAGLSLVRTLPATGIVTQSFRLAPVVGQTSSSDTIGTLTFKVYLTDSSSTPVSLSNISFTTSSADIPPDCIASIGDSGASFTYLYRCGDSILLDAMEGKLPFVIESVQPNPAQSEILVGYRVLGLGYSDMEIELENILGQTVLTQHSASAAADTQHSTEAIQHLDVSSIPSGIYFLRLSENGYVESRQVVIEK